MVMENQPIPQPGKGEVLIRTAYSTIHAYDKFLLKSKVTEGGYVPGAEGSGIIIKTGDGVDKSLEGRKVCYLHNAWGTHAIKKLDYMMQFDEEVDLKQATIGYINPLTAVALLDLVRQKEGKNIITTASASHINKQFIKLAERYGINVINIVRRDKQVEILEEETNAKYIVNSSSDNFIDEMKSVIDEL